MKLRQVYRYRLRGDLKQLGVTYIGLFVGVILFPLLVNLTTRAPHAMRMANYLKTNAFQVLIPFFFVGVGSLVYRDFSILIQNGISRGTYWWGKLASLISVAVLVSGINVIYRRLVSEPFGMDNYRTDAVHFFGAHAGSGLMPGLWMWLLDLATLVMALAFGMMIGSVMGLLNRRWKAIVIVTMPFIGAGLLWFIFASAGGSNQSYASTWIGSALHLLFGFDAQSGKINPLNIICTELVLSVIGFSISHAFNRLLRVRTV